MKPKDIQIRAVYKNEGHREYTYYGVGNKDGTGQKRLLIIGGPDASYIGTFVTAYKSNPKFWKGFFKIWLTFNLIAGIITTWKHTK